MGENKNVSWTIFAWTVAIVTVMLAAVWATQISLMKDVSEIRQSVSKIETDIVWIKQALNKSQLSLK